MICEDCKGNDPECIRCHGIGDLCDICGEPAADAGLSLCDQCDDPHVVDSRREGDEES